MSGIFGRRLLFVEIAGDGITIRNLTVDDLRHENLGHRSFVRDILSTICSGQVYDDSDPTAYVDGGPFYYYLSSDKAEVDGVPLSVLTRLLEILKDPIYHKLARRLRELGREANTVSPARLRELDEERAEIEAELAEALAQLLEEVPDEGSAVPKV